MEPDYVNIKLWGAPFMLTKEKKPIFKAPLVLRVRIPAQSSQNDASVIATEAVAATINTTGKVILWIQFITNLFFS